MRSGRIAAPAGELVFGQAAGPAVEDLQRAGAGLHLAEQIGDRGFDQEIDEALERGGIAIGPEPRRAPDPCCRRPRPCRSRPSTAPRKSRSAARPPAAPAPRARRSRRPAQIALPPLPGRASPDPCRSAPARASGLRLRRTRPSARAHTARSRMSEKTIAASRSNRRKGCSVTSAASAGLRQRSRKEPALALHLPIFREIAPGLAHQPDRRRVDGLPAQS